MQSHLTTNVRWSDTQRYSEMRERETKAQAIATPMAKCIGSENVYSI